MFETVSQQHPVAFGVFNAEGFGAFFSLLSGTPTSNDLPAFSPLNGGRSWFECIINLLFITGPRFDRPFALIKKTIKCDPGIFNRVKNQKRGSFGIFA